MAQAALDATEKEFQFDPVTVEIERFKYLAPEEVEPFMRADGLLDEFHMMYAFRNRFPLHFIIFKQTARNASHLPHEANVEQVFSRAGGLADPGLKPHHLSILTKVGMNKKNFMPCPRPRTSRSCTTTSSVARPMRLRSS